MRVFRGAEAGMVRWNVIDFRFGGKIYVVLDTNVDYNRLIEILSSNFYYFVECRNRCIDVVSVDYGRDTRMEKWIIPF